MNSTSTHSHNCPNSPGNPKQLSPPQGVLRISAPSDNQLEIHFDPSHVNDEQIHDYALSLREKLASRSLCILKLKGRACEACAHKLAQKVTAIQGVRRATATFVGGTMSIEFDSSTLTPDTLVSKIQRFGIPVTSWSDNTLWKTRYGEITLTVLTLFFILSAWMIPYYRYWLLTCAYGTGGYFGLKAAWLSLKELTIDVDLLMILAAIGAYCVNAPMEGAVLLFLFSLSNVLQNIAIDRTRKAIDALLKLRPKKALVKRDNKLLTLPIEELKIGDIVIVKPGETIPLDGYITEGETSIDESSLTGESMPVLKQRKDQVFAGTLNQTGSIEIQVTKLAQDSSVTKLIQLVEAAQSEKASTQKLLDRTEQFYAIGVLILTILLTIIPWLLNHPFAQSLYKAITVMVVASPCALVISTPASILSAIGGAARHGVLFKGGIHLEKAAQIEAVAFDKTGTLTTGKPKLTYIATPTKIYSMDDELNEESRYLLTLAASIELKSEHPIAHAIVQEARRRKLAFRDVTNFRSFSGRGAGGEIEGKTVRIGSIKFFDSTLLADVCSLGEKIEQLERDGNTVVCLSYDSHLLGALAVADELRPDAASSLSRLKSIGIKKLIMLTGDNKTVARAIGNKVGIDEIYSELMPEDKLKLIKSLKQSYRIAMVGDGINDAPALAVSDLGIAMGAAGTDVALETADVVFMGEQLKHLPFTFIISRKALQIVRQNLTFSCMVILTLVLATIVYNLTLPLGVLGHEGSTVLVCLNGLRLLLLHP